MDSDREDGEVSEGDAKSHPSAVKINGRAHPEPPRSVPYAKPQSPRVEEAYNPDQPAAGQLAIKAPVRKPPQQAPAENPMDIIQQHRDHAKQFIKLLHSNNIGYRTLAKEPLDLEQLRGLYQSLNLPSEPAPILPPKAVSMEKPKAPVQASVSPAVQPLSRDPSQQQKPAPTLKTNISAVPPTSAAPSPVIDRRDYIARLQAAKLAKQAGASKTSPPRATPPATVARPPQPAPLPAKPPQPATAPNAKPPVTDEQRARNTELIKQRLEVIKAQKNMVPATNGTTSASSSAQKHQSVRSGAEQVARPAPPSTSTPNNQSYVPPFPGIPGLFMNPPPSFDSGASRSIPQKRPAPSDSTVSTPRGSVTPYTRPLGDSPHAYHEEPMIIEVSDDESNGSDMDIDDDQPPSRSAVISPTNNRHQLSGSILDFPAQPTSGFPGSSGVSTPGSQTPTTHAREQELKKKEDELAAMRMTLKRKLAEKREKDKAAAAAAVASSSASQSQPTTTTSVQNDLTRSSNPVYGSSQSLRAQPGSASSDTLNDASELIRDVKRRRREEIQARLPSFDAELAMNTNKMAQLMREMELLKAQNDKITEDKERLTSELENLGVDTEGMSHAEMRAKKDEIEQEMLPEFEVTTQGVELVSTTDASAPMDDSSVAPVQSHQDDIESQEVPAFATLPGHTDVSNQYATLPGLGHGLQQQSKNSILPSQVSVVDEPVNNTRSQPQELVQEAESLDTPVHAVAASEVQDMITPLDEEEDFYSPAPAVEPVVDESIELEHAVQAHPEIQAADARSPSEEGEVEMSVSSEDEDEEYEPEEPTIITETHIQDPQVPEIDTAKSVLSNDISTEDEEAYEPPDVDEQMSDLQADDEVVDADATALGVEAEDGAMDIASSSSEDSDSDSDSDGEITSVTGNNGDSYASHALQQNTNVADDIAPELQPESAQEPVRPPLAAKPS
jgi:hypothetical protein